MNNPAGPKTRMSIVGDYLIKYPLRYAAPVYIGRLTATDQQLLASGTAVLLQIGTRQYVVTDDHVLAQYEREHGADPSVAFQIGRARFDPFSRLVDRSAQKDLCVIFASGLALDDRSLSTEAMPPLEFYRVEPESWPPPLVNIGDAVIWAGFPGKFRRQDGFDVTSASLSCAAAPVTGVMPDYLPATSTAVVGQPSLVLPIRILSSVTGVE